MKIAVLGAGAVGDDGAHRLFVVALPLAYPGAAAAEAMLVAVPGRR